MIRRIQMPLGSANPGKLAKLDEVMRESLRVLNAYIDLVWASGDTNKFARLEVPTWLSARLQQCLTKQAVEAVKSQRKKRKKTKPVVRKPTITLDERFLSFSEDANSFDFWVRLTCLGSRICVNMPSRKHRHFAQYRQAGWELRKGGRLRKTEKGWFLDVFVEKDSPPLRTEGTALGLDTGYKKMLAGSDGKIYDAGLTLVYEKISRKRQGSAAFKRALVERDQKINQSVNGIDFTGIRAVVVEALLSVKKGSRGKIRKDFTNKLQRWSYPRVLGKLQSVCEVRGINFSEVDPAYTSQTCSLCGHVDGLSRSGEKFCCTRCGMTEDADINAAKNILMRGACSPPSVKQGH